MDYPVLITKKINFPLTYKSGALGKLKVGDIVTVPFGKSEEIGVIWDKKQITKKKFKTKLMLKLSLQEMLKQAPKTQHYISIFF